MIKTIKEVFFYQSLNEYLPCIVVFFLILSGRIEFEYFISAAIEKLKMQFDREGTT